MPYDYVTEFELCALLFLLAVTIRFHSMRKFPNRLNRLFGLIVHVAIVDIVLDVAGAFTVTNAAGVAPWVNYVINTLYYLLQVSFPALLIYYVLTMIGRAETRRLPMLIAPAAFCILLLLINFFTPAVFYLKPTETGLVYTHADLFNVLYAVPAVYLFVALGTTLYWRKLFRKTELRIIVAFVLLIIAATFLQIIFPRYLLTGVAVSVAILMMFFTFQNPETMLDLVTGVFNYNALNEYLRVEIAEKRSMWLIALDVGGLRRINSALGHRVGNELLGAIGSFLNKACSGQANVFRTQGAKFLIVTGHAEALSPIALALAKRFDKPWSYEDMEIPLVATIRYSEEEGVFTSPEEVINLVDMAFSVDASESLGRSLPMSAGLLTQSKRRLQIEEAIRRALGSKEGFSIRLQPLYSVCDGRFHSAEVLLRLHDGVLGEIPPDEFIPLAENTGLIRQIDRLVVDMACRFLREHPGLRALGLKRLEINLSAGEFYGNAEELAAEVLQKLDTIGGQICFEVTETAATTHWDILSDFMNTLIRHGVRFALDDFGTGYANITRIMQLPFSIVKLDSSLLSETEDQNGYILEDLSRMFRRLGLTTVIEGVETAEQVKLAAGFGIEQIQGFYYSKPLTEQAFVELLQQTAQPSKRQAPAAANKASGI